jgi:hypothetical protein
MVFLPMMRSRMIRPKLLNLNNNYNRSLDPSNNKIYNMVHSIETCRSLWILTGQTVMASMGTKCSIRRLRFGSTTPVFFAHLFSSIFEQYGGLLDGASKIVSENLAKWERHLQHRYYHAEFYFQGEHHRQRKDTHFLLPIRFTTDASHVA